MKIEEITVTFTITAAPVILRRIERFLALLHWNSRFGHSGTFAMPLDGDGHENVTVYPVPGYKHEVDLIGGVGGDVEVAWDQGYTVKKMQDLGISWVTRSAGALYKNGELRDTYPSQLYSDDTQKKEPKDEG